MARLNGKALWLNVNGVPGRHIKQSTLHHSIDYLSEPTQLPVSLSSDARVPRWWPRVSDPREPVRRLSRLRVRNRLGEVGGSLDHLNNAQKHAFCLDGKRVCVFVFVCVRS